ncbi:putative sugar nucleotidyl transferase, partial [Arthrospira platensis SPKY1]|nr:putative sugar nucleotidyl transferase [Arthrospira platensis SPKY1]
VNAAILPSGPLVKLIAQLDVNEALLWNGDLVAAKFNQEQFNRLMTNEDLEDLSAINLEGAEFSRIESLSDIFRYNDQEIRQDFRLLTEGRQSQPISATNTVIGDEIFLE